MMRKSVLLFFSLCLTVSINAQVYWFNDQEAARSKAKQLDKLILIDFWATWCGPCNKMDRELWNHPEIPKVSKNFVGLKIDVDYNKSTAMYYNAQSIPKVVLTTFTGEPIWQTVGYSNAESYLSIIRSIPENVKQLNTVIQLLEDNKKDSRANLLVGVEYQQIGKAMKNNDLKSSFLASSEKYFSRAQKYGDDTNLTEEIELFSILNDIYLGHPQKALKKIEKMDVASKDGDLTEFRHFVLAICYKNMNDQINFQKEKQQIRKTEWIDQLGN